MMASIHQGLKAAGYTRSASCGYLDSNASGKVTADHDDLLTKLFLAIREDMGILPHPPASFRFKLWAGGRRSQ